MNTPTPWLTDKYGHVCTKLRDDGMTWGGTDVCITGFSLSRGDEERANTALILRAVNSHQSLIDALEKIIKADAYRMAAIAAPDGEKHYEPATENFWAAIDKGRAALALAKEPT